MATICESKHSNYLMRTRKIAVSLTEFERRISDQGIVAEAKGREYE